jgi:hypothetical protein
MAKKTKKHEYDHAWKEVIDRYFEPFVAFFFPAAHGMIDWSRGYVALDKELRKIQRESAHGKREADKLVKVWLQGGEEIWVLIHVEIQNQEEAEFAKRIFVYNYRIFDRYNHKVASFVILGDDRANWRPDHFAYELFGCSMGIRFPIVKLLDFRSRWAELEASDNPFATVVMAHLKSLDTRADPSDCLSWKLKLLRPLYERGLDGDTIRGLFLFIDMVMLLPPTLESAFISEVEAIEEEKKMPFITSAERVGRERGREEVREEARKQALQAFQEGIQSLLRVRFGKADKKLMAKIREIQDVSVLKRILTAAETVEEAWGLQEFFPPK